MKSWLDWITGAFIGALILMGPLAYVVSRWRNYRVNEWERRRGKDEVE